MITKIQDWLVNTAFGRVSAVLAQFLVSYVGAHNGTLQHYGAAVSLDPVALQALILSGISGLYHLIVHQNPTAQP